jgi:hypothetical protein
MKTRDAWLLLVFAVSLISVVPPCRAQGTCYNYIVGYSYRSQIVYYTPIFTSDTSGVSYNQEEYVADTETSLKLETAFQQYLVQKLKVSSPDLTVSARVAYKTDQIAKKRQEKEIDDFRFRGFTLKEVSAFRYH